MIKLIFCSIVLVKCILGIDFQVTIQTGSPVRSVSKEFLSVTYDSSNADSPNWIGLNFSVVEPLASALKPAYFRFGGTSANFINYQMTSFTENEDEVEKRSVKNAKRLKKEKKRLKKFGGKWSGNFTMTAQQFDQLYTFSKNIGWRFIFDLNELKRKDNGTTWDSTNAKELLDYTSSKGYDFDFELGNEQDIIQPRLTSQQNVQDYKDLRALLDSYPIYKNSLVMGPSTAGASSMFSDFVKNGGGKYINALSFHHYYFGADGSTIEDFMDVKRMDSLIGDVKGAAAAGFSPVWLGETSSAYNGGGKNLSNTFLAGYLWLDKLGVSALYGLDAVLRQEIYGTYQIGDVSSYSLINMDMRPAPDYFLSFLHKKLVGQQIYNVSFTPAEKNLRIYAASNAKVPGSYVVYGFNLLNQSLTLNFPDYSTQQVVAYVITPNQPGVLLSHVSNLNGQPQQWSPHEPIVNIKGSLSSLPLQIPEYGQFFIVLGQPQSQSCPSGWIAETSVTKKCVKIVNQTQPWFGANFDCSAYGSNASLLSISNAFENAEILKNAASFSNSCKQFYIGLYRSGNSFTWSNNNPNSFLNWKLGYPTSDATQNCVSYDTASGQWVNNDCDQSQCYICQQYY